MTSSLSTNAKYGPIEVFVVEFEGAEADPKVLDALLELSASGAVRVVDVIVASRRFDGTVQVTELRDYSASAMSVFGVELEIEGLIAEEDVAESLEQVAPGSGVAIAAIEMRWAATLSARLNASGGKVIRTERITGTDVNALVAMALGDEEEVA